MTLMKTRRSKSAFAFAFVLAIGAGAPRTCAAQNAPADAPLADKLAAIEKTLDKGREQFHIPGVSLVIVKDGQVIYSKGLGLRDVAKKLPVTPNTLFAIGSSSKAFTAMTVMMSVDEGKMSLTERPRTYLPYFKMRDPDTDNLITVADLLSHRSGLERTDLAWSFGTLTPEETIRVACNAKPTAKLGERFQYQNVMVLAAGECVAAVQEMPWQEFVAKRIFRPLGMKSTETSIQAMQKAADYSLGYASYDESQKAPIRLPMRDLRSIAPAGGINSNAVDMAQWLRFLLDGGVVRGKRLVSQASFAELWKPRINVVGKMDYGLGWFLRDWNGHKVVEHGGNVDGFNAEVALMPDQKLGFVLLTNVSASSLGEVAQSVVWNNLVGTPKAAAPVAAAIPQGPPADPKGEVGTYRLEEAKLDVVIALKDGKLTAAITGQPVLPLAPVAGRRYQIGPPAPPGIFLTFRQNKDNAQLTELALDQPNGVSVVFKRQMAQPAFTAAISVDDLMQKAIAAAGGEANLRKHRTLLAKYDLSMDSQGLTGQGCLYARAPASQTLEMTVIGAGKKVGAIRSYFDGDKGGTQVGRSAAMAAAGKELADTKANDDFNWLLNWKRLYKVVTIVKMEKVGDDEAYVVEMTPEGGTPQKRFFSTKTCLLLKEERTVTARGMGISIPVTDLYSDYRPVDGVMIAYRRQTTATGISDVVMTLKSAKFDVSLRDSVFLAAK